MILDKNTMIADALAYNGTPNVIDLETATPGRSNKILLWAQGSANLAGVTGLTITDGPTNGAANALLTWTCTLAGKMVEITLPSDTDRYLKVVLAGAPSAGSWSAGIVVDGIVTNCC